MPHMDSSTKSENKSISESEGSTINYTDYDFLNKVLTFNVLDCNNLHTVKIIRKQHTSNFAGDLTIGILALFSLLQIQRRLHKVEKLRKELL